ncbi:hypothetical protein [Pueribacillus theae]|nr:hypothetical protein [Pueribacillus theae]
MEIIIVIADDNPFIPGQPSVRPPLQDLENSKKSKWGNPQIAISMAM